MRQLIIFFLIIGVQFSLLGQEVVLVTGASRGIGYAIAERLSLAGYTVYGGVRKKSFSQEYHFFPIELDVKDQASIDQAISTIVEKEGKIDVLVNNAGIMIYGSIENVTVDEAKEIFEVNFFGMMRITQGVLPIMRARKEGKIIQISSRSGFRPLPSISVYAASKHALEGMSETMAALLKPWNIHVSLIEPGPVNTDFDTISPYGSRLTKDIDPFYPIFKKAGLLDIDAQSYQDKEEIALLVQEVIEEKKPSFRYQTTEQIKRQAAFRFVDPTGDRFVNEWEAILMEK